MQRNPLNFVPALLIFSVMAPCVMANDNDATEPRRRVEPFALSQVRLLESPFKAAQDKDAAYLLSVDPDRLLAKFRVNAGLQPKKPHYEGWEAQTIAGHSLGHYHSAVSMMYAATGDERFKTISDYIVDELAVCQEAGKDGLVSAVPDIRKVFEEVGRGDIHSQGFDLNGLWVPWYSQHKVFAGLVDAHKHCGNEKALDILKKLGDWGIEATKNLTDEQFQKMCDCEFGGINESYFELYALTGDEKYLKMGDRFYHAKILDPFFEGVDNLPGRHGNTQFPKVIGMARRYELTGDERIAKMVAFFWDRVVNHHSYVTGGNTMGEHFAQPDRLNDRLSDVTTESCNTYNMLKITQHLYQWSGEPVYYDFYERALFNHILASIDRSDDPNKLFTYFVPLKSGGFRRYSNREHDWSCCHGTGMENHAKYGEAIYFRGKASDGSDRLLVNLLIPSTLDWAEKGVKVSVLPGCGVRVEASRDFDTPIWVRVPRNVHCSEALTPCGYYVLDCKALKAGENYAETLPFETEWRIETMPDNENRIAFFNGPWLFAGDLGPINRPVADRPGEASGDTVRVPVIVANSRNFAALIDESNTGESCSCCAEHIDVKIAAAKPIPVEMVPFYDATQRYSVYFDMFSSRQWDEEQARYKAEQERLARIAALTVDAFQPGEMQPERDHDFNGERTVGGEHMGRKWRDARDGGFLEFDMKVEPETACVLVLTYWGDDAGNRVFDVMIDGEKIATQRLERNAPGRFFDVTHEIANPDKKAEIRVRLQGHPGAMVGGLFGAKTMRVESPE